MTRNQDLRSSEVSIQRPRMSWFTSGVTPSATYGLVAERAPRHGFDPQRVEDQRIHGLERPVLPFGHRLQNRVGHRRNEIGRDLKAIKLQKMALDLANDDAARTSIRSSRRNPETGADSARSASDRSSPADREGCRRSDFEVSVSTVFFEIRCRCCASPPPARRPDGRRSRVQNAFRQSFVQLVDSPSSAEQPAGHAPPANRPGCLS